MPQSKYHLKENLIHVWSCSFSKSKSKLSRFEGFLSENEKKRAAKVKFEKDKSSFIISRGVLREILSGYLGISPSKVTFEYTSYGKPFLSKYNLKFNISHSGDLAVFVFNMESEIGVDIERIKNNLNVLELTDNFFSKNEIESLHAMPPEQLNRAFYRCWTRKEAFIKAEGSGLSFPLNQFTVSLDNDCQATLLKTEWDSSEKENWSLFSFVPEDGYLVAVAVRQKLVSVRYFSFEQ